MTDKRRRKQDNAGGDFWVVLVVIKERSTIR